MDDKPQSPTAPQFAQPPVKQPHHEQQHRSAAGKRSRRHRSHRRRDSRYLGSKDEIHSSTLTKLNTTKTAAASNGALGRRNSEPAWGSHDNSASPVSAVWALTAPSCPSATSDDASAVASKPTSNASSLLLCGTAMTTDINVPQSSVSSPPGPAGTKDKKQRLYKTELCRNWQENDHCRYGDKCQYAHGPEDLRDIERHPKYKTQICRTFSRTGSCPYGSRCTFKHDGEDVQDSPAASVDKFSTKESASFPSPVMENAAAIVPALATPPSALATVPYTSPSPIIPDLSLLQLQQPQSLLRSRLDDHLPQDAVDLLPQTLLPELFGRDDSTLISCLPSLILPTQRRKRLL